MEKIVCACCGDETAIKNQYEMADGQRLCDRCRKKLPSLFWGMLESNEMNVYEHYDKFVQYSVWLNENYGMQFKATHVIGSLQLDFFHRLLKIQDVILPIDDITSFHIPLIRYEKERDLNTRIRIMQDKYYYKSFPCRFWLKEYPYPIEIPLFVNSVECVFGDHFIIDEHYPVENDYEKVDKRYLSHEYISFDAYYRAFRMALLLTFYGKKNPRLLPILDDFVLDKKPSNSLNDAIYLFGFSDISQLTKEGIWNNYRAIIELMMQVGIVEEHFVERINQLYCLLKNAIC